MYKSYDQIVSELQSDLISNGSQATDFSDGSEAQTQIAVTARALRSVWYMLEQMTELFFVSSTDGPFLDLRVGERGVTRKSGVAATGAITFTRTTPSPVGTLVPAGTQFSTLDGSVTLQTTADANLATNWTTGTANVVDTVGEAAGNLAEGTVLQVAGPTVIGLQTIAVGPGALTGGVDPETDDELRARYLEIIQNPVDGGTPADYEIWAKEVTGIIGATPIPLARGNGTVDVVVTNGGIPDANTVAEVQSVLDANRPVGADARALAPTAHSIDSTITVTLAPGYSLSSMESSILQAYNNYLSTIAIGGVYRTMAAADAIFKLAGIIDCSVSGANIQLGQEEMAVPGNVSVEQGS